VPAWAEVGRGDIFFIYNGASMRPLFKPGDLLCARRIPWEDIKVGDVVIFSSSVRTNSDRYIVHRVISVKHDGLFTQGDNNFVPDGEIVSKDRLVGQVVYFNRRRRVNKVNRGTVGIYYFYFVYIRNYIWAFLKRKGKGLYIRIHKSGWVNDIWKPKITKIHVMTDSGKLIKYCFYNFTVARWWPEKRQFDVVKPFDLVIPCPQEVQ